MRTHCSSPALSVNMELQASGPREGMAVRNEAIQTDAGGGNFVWALKEREAVGETDWTCTMHPEISEDGPGICPICKMDLTPRESTAKFIAVRKPVVIGAPKCEYDNYRSRITKRRPGYFRWYRRPDEGSPVAPVAWGESGPAELPAGSCSSGGHDGH